MKLRFIIRDLLWLTLVAALAIGWWLDHRQLNGKYQRLVEDSRYQQAKLKVEMYELRKNLEAMQSAN